VSEKQPEKSARPAGPRPWWDISGLNPNLMKLLAIGVALGVIYMTVPDLFGVGRSSGKATAGAVEVAAPRTGKENDIEALQQREADRLAAILSQVRGAGQVSVMVTYDTSVINVPVTNTNTQQTKTKEHASDDSVRDSDTTTTTVTNVMAGDAVAVSQQQRPKVAGVTVVADGAGDARVRYDLTQAVARQLDIPSYKVTVRPRQGRNS
jgi:stage III sporulation protein AG